jgi:hypothetical protein
MSDAPEPPLTPALLADLQAGLLDDATAARVRQRVRSEPAAAGMLAALDRTRSDLDGLGSDEASAPDMPADVARRIGAALRDQRPAHAVRRPRLGRFQVIALVVGVAAALAAVGIGTAMLKRDPAPPVSTGPTAKSITVPPRNIPLSGPQILGLLSRPPDYGLLGDPQRRGSCLSGLGYPSTTAVLGAQPVDMAGRPGVLMVLPGDTPKAIVALVVDPNCSSAHTSLLADTVVARP